MALSSNISIDPETLQNVFGNAPNAGPASGVTPNNGTLVDPDYWDSDDNYMPANADYDKFDWILSKASYINDLFL